MNSKLLIAIGVGLALAAGILLLTGDNADTARYVGTWHGTSVGQWQFAALDILSEEGESLGSGYLEEEFEYEITVALAQSRLGRLTAAVEIGQQSGSDPLESMTPAKVRVKDDFLTITFDRHVVPFDGAAIDTTLEFYLSLDDNMLIGTGLYVADLEIDGQGAFNIHGEEFPNERMTIRWPNLWLQKAE